MDLSSSRHEAIHKEALKLILDKGFRGATMRDLAAQVGCDVSNLYNYFPSKQDLLCHHLFDMSRRFHTGLAEIESSGLEPISQVQELVRFYVRLSFDMPLQCALLVNEWRHLEEVDRSRFVSERHTYELKVQKMVGKGIRDGSFSKLDAVAVTHMILSSLRWLFQYVHAHPKANRIKLEHNITEFILNGIVCRSTWKQ